ncbi:hypothetical protein V1506DRAFT_572118 [Lipomyces tetrasporus]
MEFLDFASTILSSIPTLTKLQVMSPGAPEVTDRLKGCTVSTSGATTMVKFDGKNYRKWAMYMEALSVQKNLWDIVSGTGFYDVTNLEDASVVIKKNNYAYLDFVLTLGDYEPGVLETNNTSGAKSENPDQWVQEWCDVLKRFLNMQTDKEDFWKVVMLNNFPEEYGGAITSLGSISDTPIQRSKANSKETAYGVNNDKKKETRTCYACGKAGHLAKDCRRNKEDNRRDNNQNDSKATAQKSGNKDYQGRPKERSLALTERMAFIATDTCKSAINVSQWYLDSGASYHYCNDITQMFDLRKDNRVVEVANSAEVEIEGIGSVKIVLTNAEGETAPFTLQEVRYSPKFSMSLLSIGQAMDTCNDEIESHSENKTHTCALKVQEKNSILAVKRQT